ncbi:hypothetical protein PBY51_014219 [Eleginops maclovinus]|uniref:Uncharacterized protein n=1 Tax=Eleginops maclovinus TaxID=56733 RepID=A0AAN7WW91_ELEMC|nr:hypothetical protein PBY51_014219 [Eleginops maclovinus]
MATRARQTLPALSHPSMQFTSQHARTVHPFQRTYAPAEEFRCQETHAARISNTSKSSGFKYPRPFSSE